jgi:putative ABC transport system substrate-binding protein
MKKWFFFLVFIFLAAAPCLAEETYHIEILQLGDVEAFDSAYDGLLDGLARQGLVKGYNLSVKRSVIDTNNTASLWGKFLTHMSMKKTCSLVIKRHPDLVITLGTPATHYFQEKFAVAGIPLIYNSATDTVPLFSNTSTGITVNTNASDVIHATLLAMPNIKTIGIIHSGNTEAVSFATDARLCSKKLGLNVITKEVDMDDGILPAARQLIERKIDAFLIPADSYYEQKGWKASREILDISRKNALPCISSLFSVTEGPFLYLCPDFEIVGNLTATYAKNILVEKMSLQELQAVNQKDHHFVVDLNVSKRLGICFRPKSISLLSLNN